MGADTAIPQYRHHALKTPYTDTRATTDTKDTRDKKLRHAPEARQTPQTPETLQTLEPLQTLEETPETPRDTTCDAHQQTNRRITTATPELHPVQVKVKDNSQSCQAEKEERHKRQHSKARCYHAFLRVIQRQGVTLVAQSKCYRSLTSCKGRESRS